MRNRQDGGRYSVVGPRGNILNQRNLPSAVAQHWTPTKKAEVVAAVRNGLLSLDEARERYSMTIEEYTSWERHLDEHGLEGLLLGKLQEYRQ